MSKDWQFYVLLFVASMAFCAAASASYNARQANSALKQIAAAIEEAQHPSKGNKE